MINSFGNGELLSLRSYYSMGTILLSYMQKTTQIVEFHFHDSPTGCAHKMNPLKLGIVNFAMCDLTQLNVAVPIPVLSSVIESPPLHTRQGVECPSILWL